MITKEINKENFEKDSLAVFERLLNGYRKAKQTSAWESDINGLVEKLTHLPTAPFPAALMKMFDYNYLALNECIGEIIDKSLIIREQMQHKMRYVKVLEKYYNLPFIPRNTHLKKLEVYNHEGELCYRLKGRLYLRLGKFIRWAILKNKRASFADIFGFKQKTVYLKNLEIYYYSPFIDLSITDRLRYYEFFCDYYGKSQFLMFVQTKELSTPPPEAIMRSTPNALKEVLSLTSSQQVLWAYFLFRLMGLKLRVNVEVATLARFLLIVNRNSLDGYRNSYFYKLVLKAPFVKEDRKLLADLEVIKLHFQRSNLPTGDIEKEILNLIAN